jgi:hypothetical protein
MEIFKVEAARAGGPRGNDAYRGGRQQRSTAGAQELAPDHGTQLSMGYDPTYKSRSQVYKVSCW